MSNSVARDLRVVHRQLGLAAANQAGRDLVDDGLRILRRTERVVAADVDLLLQEIRAHPAHRAVAALFRLAARTLRRDFPVPVAELAAQTDDTAQVVGLDVPLARPRIDGAIAADADASWRVGNGLPG